MLEVLWSLTSVAFLYLMKINQNVAIRHVAWNWKAVVPCNARSGVFLSSKLPLYAHTPVVFILHTCASRAQSHTHTNQHMLAHNQTHKDRPSAAHLCKCCLFNNQLKSMPWKHEWNQITISSLAWNVTWVCVCVYAYVCMHMRVSACGLGVCEYFVLRLSKLT